MNHPAGAIPASTAQSGGKAPLIGIQYLRAIGAMLIVYFHNVIQIPAYTPYLTRYFLGGIHLTNGVDLFFVVSGFIMLVTSRKAAPVDFLVRRVIRIAPLYWALTLLVAGFVAVRPELFRSTVLNAQYLVKSLLFVPYLCNGYFFPLLVPGWSLNFEMFFYLAFALILFVPHHRRVTIMGLSFLTLYFLGIWILHSMDPTNRNSSVINFYTSLHLFEFWSGMFVADLHLRGYLKFWPVIGWLLLAASFVALLWGLPLNLASGSSAEFLLDSLLPSVTLLLAVVSLENTSSLPKSSRLTQLGDASYSLYLTHIFSLGLARLLWARAGLQRESIVFVAGYAVFAMTLCVLIAVATYRWVENPTHNWLLAWYRNRRSARVARLQTT
jgi:exopolysaccharide production protein ExoZ